jgi:hypothetical protein
MQFPDMKSFHFRSPFSSYSRKAPIIKLLAEIRIFEHVLEDNSRITKPDFVVGKHPAWRGTLREFTSIFDREGLPWSVTKWDGVDQGIQFLVRREGSRGPLRDP